LTDGSITTAARASPRAGEALARDQATRWPHPDALLQSGLRAVWFVVIPVLLAALTFRHLVPTPAAARDGWAAGLARFGDAHPIALTSALFFLFAGLVRYWAVSLPGGRYLAAVPAHLVARLPRDQVALYASAAKLREALRPKSIRERLRGTLSESQNAELDAHVEELDRALAGQEDARVGAAMRGTRALARPVLRRKAWRVMAGQLIAVAMAAGAALLVRGTLLGAYQVLSASMLPTLEPNDLIAGSKVAFGLRLGARAFGVRLPHRGDVVVFQKPVELVGPNLLVKRVVGVPGDRIAMNGGHPVINGWQVPSCDAGAYLYPIPEGGIAGRLSVEFLEDRAYLTLFAPGRSAWASTYEVKPGEVFVLGDNRNNSSDSRAWDGGQGRGLPWGSIEARATRWLFGVHRDQTVDLARLFRPLDLRVRLDGLDARSLEEGIARCIEGRPTDTQPPRSP
jgi:signal peptidase I